MSVTEILDQFDTAAEKYEFPDLGNGYSHAVDVRLHAYSDVRRWALIVEQVGYSPRAGNLTDILNTFGNCLTEGVSGAGNGDFLDRIDNWDDVEDREEPEIWTGASFVVRGRALSVAGEAGEELVDVLRRLVPVHRELLLADENELRRRIPAGLPEVLRLDEWRQPDLSSSRPSESTVFRQIAEVLATGDPGRYAPAARANTHWSFWPESGSL
ncbi:DUF7003 family protein [Actinoplanes philippinensis]|uniref:DUF7003 family protein n=1 Tax=Actinoplanes philippinensis TaxID=35752 RepID=UPI0033D001D9